MRRFCILTMTCFIFLTFSVQAIPADTEAIDPKERCPVCGMFVAKYPLWLAEVSLETGKVFYFDGVKDMMAYYFAPADFGGTGPTETARIRVKDYYSQKWIDGRTAMYVIGSDALGPMGHELIPFGTEAAAKNFLKDHHGTEVLSFSQITAERITSMRKGHTMKMMRKNK